MDSQGARFHVKEGLKKLVDFFEETHDPRCNEAINDLHMGLDCLREDL